MIGSPIGSQKIMKLKYLKYLRDPQLQLDWTTAWCFPFIPCTLGTSALNQRSLGARSVVDVMLVPRGFWTSSKWFRTLGFLKYHLLYHQRISNSRIFCCNQKPIHFWKTCMGKPFIPRIQIPAAQMSDSNSTMRRKANSLEFDPLQLFPGLDHYSGKYV